MNNFTITKRMKALADSVLQGFPVCDVGTDHGIVPIHMLAENMVSYVILSDINKGPLERAKENLRKAGIDPKYYDLRLCSGLEGLKNGEVASIIIAGMGGELIADIMAKDIEKSLSYKRFVLQPRTRSNVLRKWLIENGFKIADEILVEEAGRICEIIVAEPGKSEPYSDMQLEIPDMWFEKKEPLLAEMLRRYTEHCRKVVQGLKSSNSEDSAVQVDKWLERIKYAEERAEKI